MTRWWTRRLLLLTAGMAGLLAACEVPGAQPGSMVIGGGEDLAATDSSKPSTLPASGEPSDPKDPESTQKPGSSAVPGGSSGPASVRPTSRPSPLPTVAPAPIQALSPAASLGVGPHGEAIFPMPSGRTGLVTLLQPGYVPLTYEITEEKPTGLSLSLAQSVVDSSGLWQLSGQVNPPQAGVRLSLSRPALGSLALGVTNAQGQFSVQVRSAARPEGILVAQTLANVPKVGLLRVQLGPEGGGLSGLNLTLSEGISAYRLAQDRGRDDQNLPTLPFGMLYVGGMLVAAEGGDRPWRADLFSLAPGMLATYRIGDFSLGRLERARNEDGTQGSEVGASLDSSFPPFLDPPLLDGVTRPSPGGRVAWPPVPGAAAYKLWLRADDGSNRLLWEAALRQASAPVPTEAPPFEGPVVLEVEAIQALGANVMHLAQWGARGLRLGDGLPGFSGRRSWSIKRFS